MKTDTEKNKKVVFFSHNSNLSGAPLSIAQIAKYLPQYGFNAFFILPKTGPLEVLLKEWSIDYKILKHPNKIISFIKIVKKENPAIIHVNSLVKTWPVIISRLLKKKVVWHIHEYLGNKRFYARTIQWVANGVILISRAQYELFSGMKNAVLIYPAVDLNRFQNAQPVSDIKEIKKRAKIIVTYVGSLVPRKGLFDLAKAAQLLGNYPWIHYVVAGEEKRENQKYVKDIVSFINSNELKSHFHFLGSRGDIPEIFASSDVFCHPAYIEAFGLVIIEAMASGLPVIATNIGELPHLVHSKKTGFIVPPGDPGALANAIYQLASNEKLRRQMGEEGLRRAQHFSVEKQTHAVARFYKNLII